MGGNKNNDNINFKTAPSIESSPVPFVSIDAGCPLLPQIENGRVEILPPSMIASKAQYSCFQGFHLAGRAARTCRPDGTWDGKEPSCERGK